MELAGRSLYFLAGNYNCSLLPSNTPKRQYEVGALLLGGDTHALLVVLIGCKIVILGYGQSCDVLFRPRCSVSHLKENTGQCGDMRIQITTCPSKISHRNLFLSLVIYVLHHKGGEL